MEIKTWRKLAVIGMWANGTVACLNFILILLTLLAGLAPQPMFYLCAVLGLIGWYAARHIKESCDELDKLLS